MSSNQTEIEFPRRVTKKGKGRGKNLYLMYTIDHRLPNAFGFFNQYRGSFKGVNQWQCSNYSSADR